ncbi:MAG: DUF2817 domain-containing protein [Proteobacteria bacterium]|nr:MAG: DUF2817 domain-containing protein [Pseudomonadota bacterium]
MSFPELAFLENLLEGLSSSARVEQVARVPFSGETFPIYTVAFGSTDPAAPTLAIVGGVHGQEKIGAQVALSYLESLSELLRWDALTNRALETSRVVFMPIVNPVGTMLLRRGNGNRVDLMRNAPPVSPLPAVPLLGGQRYSPYLPWYQGPKGAPMEIESQALCDFMRREVLPARTSIAVDCHSGYGNIDRLWFPYSYAAKPYPDLAEAFALKNLLDNTYPNHVYRMEPGAQGYTISGDIWDYLYEEHRAQHGRSKRFFPVTLEMGSWTWLKKNPVQILSAMGAFNPMNLHRHRRILRRHITLFDFFHRAVISPEAWAFPEEEEARELRAGADDYWYGGE